MACDGAAITAGRRPATGSVLGGACGRSRSARAVLVVAVTTLIAAAGPADAAFAVAPTRAAQPALVLRVGARGPAVRALQDGLAGLAFLPWSGVDGRFGLQTWHAVVAFQGCNRLSRDGIAGPRTLRALSLARRPAPWSTARGIEIHVSQQVLMLVGAGRVQRVIHVSTGMNGTTPAGHFRIYRRDRLSWSVPFHVWMPLAQYFSGGYALHAFATVPAYPASHGCVRIPTTDALEVWRFASTGTRVWTRP